MATLYTYNQLNILVSGNIALLCVIRLSTKKTFSLSRLVTGQLRFFLLNWFALWPVQAHQQWVDSSSAHWSVRLFGFRVLVNLTHPRELIMASAEQHCGVI